MSCYAQCIGTTNELRLGLLAICDVLFNRLGRYLCYNLMTFSCHCLAVDILCSGLNLLNPDCVACSLPVSFSVVRGHPEYQFGECLLDS